MVNKGESQKGITMNTELLDKTIKDNDLYGRSFTYGVAFRLLVERDYFSYVSTDESIEDLEWQLAEYNANALGGDSLKFHNQLSLKQLVAITDIAVLDELVTEFVSPESEEA